MSTQFELKGGRWVKTKDPGSNLFYSIDFTGFLALAGTTLSSIVSTDVQGVTVTVAAVIVSGLKVKVKLSGLDTLDGARNFCRFRLQCANGESFDATMWFEREEG